MAGTPAKTGPQFVTVAAVNLLTVAANTYVKVYHIHLVNSNAAARIVNLFVGATGGSAAGTQILAGHSIAGAGSTTLDDFFDIYWSSGLRMSTADFLTATSSADGTSVVATVTYEIFAV